MRVLCENKDNLESYVTSCVVNFLKDKKNAEMAVDDVSSINEKRTDEDNLEGVSLHELPIYKAKRKNLPTRL